MIDMIDIQKAISLSQAPFIVEQNPFTNIFGSYHHQYKNKIKKVYSTISVLVLFVFHCFFPDFSFAQAGTLDFTFGTGGIVTTDFGSTQDIPYAVAIQNDGKILVSGCEEGGIGGMQLARYNSNGSLDITFGTGGKVIADSGTAFVNSLIIQNDGKILVPGKNVNSNAHLLRFNSDGSLDTSFGLGGIANVNFTSLVNYPVLIALQNDGKIVLTATESINTVYYFSLARFEIGGTLDSTFGTNGKTITNIGSDHSLAIEVQPDDKIVISGTTHIGPAWKSVLLRYNANGILDSTFSQDGISIINYGCNWDFGNAVAIQSDGKIVQAGNCLSDIAIARCNSDGSLDYTFGTLGMVITSIGSGSDKARSIAIQNDGKIVIAGESYNGSGYDFALIRYNSNGSLDNTFGSNGIVLTDIALGWEWASSVAIQNDGKIVAAGPTQVPFFGWDFGIARYNGNGSVDINDETKDNLISPSPNPFTDEIKINSSNKGEIVLSNITGKEVLRQKSFEGEIILNTKNIPSGFYLLHHFDGKTNRIFKIVKP